MFHTMPDPHPGRCRNHRSVGYGYDAKSVRCLEYEATEHICRFPEVARAASSVTYSISSISRPPPKPWVRPEKVTVGIKDQGAAGLARLARS